MGMTSSGASRVSGLVVPGRRLGAAGTTGAFLWYSFIGGGGMTGEQGDDQRAGAVGNIVEDALFGMHE